jgi:hypothetical protein
MPVKPIVSGLGLVPGSVRLILMRTLASLVIALPAMIAALAASDKAARSDFFASAPVPMPANQFMALMGNVVGGAAVALPLMLLLTLAFKFFLDGGAMRLFALQARRAPRRGPWRTIFGEGWSYFWAMLRIAILPGILVTAAVIGIAVFFRSYGDMARLPADRTAYATFIEAPAYAAAGFLIWAWLMGALALHMRAVAVVHERKNTFLAFWRGLGLLVRRPGQATLFYLIVSAVVAVLSAWIVIAWRGTDPRGGMLYLWIGLWLGAIVLQAYVWHWLARSAVLLSVMRDLPAGADSGQAG